jgi:hypothetical protein
MKQLGISWPKLLAALVLFLVAGIVLWILHVILHDSIGISLLLLSVISMLAFFLTVLLMALKFFKMIWRKV